MQRLSSVLAGALVMGLVVGLSARPAQASDFDRLTYLTFSGPVEIPGLVLPAGTYIFELANPETGSRLVRVSSTTRKTVYATFFVLPDRRLNAADNALVAFRERPAGFHEAIKNWFYPGDTTGLEFVYPKEEPMRIAGTAPSSETKSSNTISQ